MREIITFQDAVEYLFEEFDLDGTDRHGRMARSAVIESLRDIVGRASWSWYNRTVPIFFTASYSTGTIAYDHTGGTYERMLTLTTGSWPTWAANGIATIDEVPYEVEQRVSSSIIILRESSNPGADVAAGETYRIDQYEYDLPDDFHAALEAWDVTFDSPFTIIPGRPIGNSNFAMGRTPGQPVFGAVYATGGAYARMRLVISPPASTVGTIQISYLAHPRELKIEAEKTGLVTTVANSQTISGSGTAFTAAHVGSIIRLSSDGLQFPTNGVGYRSTQKTNPFVFQGRILRVASATSLIVEDAPDTTYTSVKFTISDAVDVAQDAMTTALLKSAARIMAVKTNQNPAAIAERAKSELRALREALETDSRLPSAQSGRVPWVEPVVTTSS